MQDHVYKLIEIVGTSHESIDHAIKSALKQASKSLRNLRWFEIISTRGSINPEGELQFQVKLKVGFTLDE
jgi:flavin-binding protein dodecin